MRNLNKLKVKPRSDLDVLSAINKNIQTVHICTPDQSETLDTVKRFLARNKQAELTLEFMNPNELNYGEFESLETLERLTLHHLSNVNVRGIFKALPPLAAFRANDINMSREMIEELLSQMENWPRLEVLGIENVEFQEQEPWVRLAKILSSEAKSCLRKLYIGKNHISEQTLASIFELLSSCIKVDFIDLTSMKNLQDWDFQKVLEAIGKFFEGGRRPAPLTILFSKYYFTYFKDLDIDDAIKETQNISTQLFFKVIDE